MVVVACCAVLGAGCTSGGSPAPTTSAAGAPSPEPAETPAGEDSGNSGVDAGSSAPVDESSNADGAPPIRALPYADVPDDLSYVFQRRMPGDDAPGDWEIALGSSNGDAVSLLRSDREWSYAEPKVSPDGKHISVIGTSLAPDTSGDQAIFLAEMSDLPNFARVPTGLTRFTCAHWAPDGASMVVSREVAPGGFRVSSVDIRSGLISDLWDESYPKNEFPCGQLVDEHTFVYYVLNKETGDVGVWQRDLETSRVEPVFEMADCFTIYPILRPGSDEVAAINNCVDDSLDGLWMVSLTDRSARRVLNGLVGAPAWSPDGRWLLFAHQLDAEPTDDPRGTDLWIARADGSQATRLQGPMATWPSWIPATVDCALCPGEPGRTVGATDPP